MGYGEAKKVTSKKKKTGGTKSSMSSCSSIPSQINGMSTTVPQNIVPHDLNCSHLPHRSLHRFRKLGSRTARRHKMRYCHLQMILVVIQTILGGFITGAAFCMTTQTPLLKIQYIPHWAGIPLCVAGFVGVIHAAFFYDAYPSNSKAFVAKVTSVSLSVVCIIICLIACIFTGLLATAVSRFEGKECTPMDAICICEESLEPLARTHIYEVPRCNLENLKVPLILQSCFNSVASFVSFIYVMYIWSRRYSKFYSGLKFYTYSAASSGMPA